MVSNQIPVLANLENVVGQGHCLQNVKTPLLYDQFQTNFYQINDNVADTPNLIPADLENIGQSNYLQKKICSYYQIKLNKMYEIMMLPLGNNFRYIDAPSISAYLQFCCFISNYFALTLSNIWICQLKLHLKGSVNKIWIWPGSEL